MFLFTSLERRPGTTSPPYPPPEGADNTLDFILGSYKINGTSYTVDQVIANTGRVGAGGLNLVWDAEFNPTYGEAIIDPALTAILSYIGTDFGVVADITDAGSDGSGSDQYIIYFSQNSDGLSKNFFGVIPSYGGGGVTAAVTDQGNTGGSRYTNSFGDNFVSTPADQRHKIAARRESGSYDSGTGVGGLGTSLDGCFLGYSGGNPNGVSETGFSAPGLLMDTIILGSDTPGDTLLRSLYIRSIKFIVPGSIVDADLRTLSTL